MRLSVTRDDYFNAAMELLGSAGPSGLKIAPLCKSLNVTSGSFYGYFGSMDGFVTEFLVFWERTQTERLAELSKVPSDLTARVHLLKTLAAKLPHDAEAAIRGWAHANPQVAEAQKAVDARRVEILTELYRPAVATRRHAETLAIMGITLLVGLQQWRSPVTRKDFNRVFNEYEQMVYRAIDQTSSGTLK
ncbi:TetR/AcrR family transcriptional regulator [Mycolicibacterium phocaicum]|uniref:TetR/AcrR family transcriptional regulator n=1 Tax=Mycolicibacterium phocaicum TaxID=319706 RepID=A0A7I7ZNL5_9MYCO|nr:TetR/AcrR family transcriptional regulator [Mycolicibacterium phocaicum]TLH73722.1 TetR/AcrR family transcriptional regulator [Mycolicibacterium phocaicum]UCZ61306.1 TetR/AcrR family transcriptional regulator [Mycolicibacterium phocaicum]BBZ55868.1 TetR family transcriptional regulator [Mycolicibacterium phocaicum]